MHTLAFWYTTLTLIMLSPDMTHKCSDCSFILKAVDPHPSCVLHSNECIAPPYFDPRKCEHCKKLFSLVKTDKKARHCWDLRLQSLENHPNNLVLHPEATEFEFQELNDYAGSSQDSVEPERDALVEPPNIQEPSASDVSLKTLQLLQRLESALLE